METVLVTGGCGFIGHHLVKKLVSLNKKVIVVDNLSSGNLEFLREILDKIEFFKIDLLDKNSLIDIFESYDINFVWHLAAEPDVRLKDSEKHFQNNVVATKNILDAMVKTNVKYIGFTSTSTVYGEAEFLPTPENYGPMIPISYYGGTKLAAEALIMSYSYENDLKSWIFRLANIIGPNLTHGVIYDFINKLRRNPNELEILGDGNQKKSYLYVEDCLDAMFFAIEKTFENKNIVEIFNIGNEDWITVKEIADVVCEEMGLKPKYIFRDETREGRGWKGDVKLMLLDISKLKKLGWNPKYTSKEAVRLTTKSLLNKNL